MKPIKIVQTKAFKFSLALALVFCIAVVYFWNGSFVSEAAWHQGETDSDKYEVLQVSGKNDSTTTLAAPVFSVVSYKSSSTDKIEIEEGSTVISGIGRCKAGDSFTIKATGEGRENFKGQNMSYTSSDTNVLKISGSGSKNGEFTATVVGPGEASIQWTYQYQKFYDEDTTEVSESVPDAEGNTTTQVITRKVTYVDMATMSGSLQATIYPQIETNNVYLKPSDTMYLKTNVKSNQKFSAVGIDENNVMSSLDWEAINGYWYILVTSKNTNTRGVIKVTAYINETLKSDTVEIIVTNDFSVTPSYAFFNCVDYKNSSSSTLQNQQTVTINTSSPSTPLVCEYIDAEENVRTISEGTAPTALATGLQAVIQRSNGQIQVILTTTEEFFDAHPDENAVSFIIRVTQTIDGTTFKGEANITVTRPVKGIEIRRDGSSYVLNSQQELYTEIGYTTNGNGLSVPKEKFPNDPDVLTARLAGLGDEEIDVQGTNGERVTSYNFVHSPYNSNITWTTTDPNVIQVDNKPSSGPGYSTCNILAVGAGRATVQAVAEDGSFVASVEYIVRPYPKKVTMKDETLYERLGELTSKQVTLIAYVTSDDRDENPAADTYLDKGLKWEISSTTSSSGESIATVDQNGVVTFNGPGTIVVRATSSVDHNGFQAYAPWAVCTITIEQPVEKISIINKPTEPIMTGDILALKTKIEPSNATDQSVVWSSANSSIVTVDKDGKVTAVGPGSTTVRVQTNSGAKYDTCTIDVKRLATGITLNRSEAKVSRGKKLTLLATVMPEDTTDKTVTWTSSDKSIATVSSKGVVTGVKVSKDPVIITATTSNGKSAECYVTVTEPVTGIKVSPKKKTIYVGKTFTIKKTLYPLGNDSINKNVTWKSSNKKVAVVDKNGKVTPKAGGKCTITCTSEDGGYIAKCVVTVKEKVTSIKLNKTKLSMVIGSTYQLKASVLKKTATNRKIKWSSSNSKVVSVDSTGKLKAKKTGKATITCSALDGSGVKAKCTVTVVRKVKQLKLNKSYITLITGYQYKTLKATVYPKNATNQKLLWTSSDSKVLSINKRTGTMFAESAGTAYVTVKTTDGSKLSRRCRVKVIDPIPVTSLTISQSTITLSKGQKSQLEVRTIPTNTTSAVLWMTDDESVATVSSTGMVTAKGAGTTTITAYCKDGIESQCTVEVIKMNPTSVTIEQYDQYTLAVDGVGTNGTITWNSSNSNVVTVTNGKIMGVKPGQAVIRATYNGKTVYCNVTVKAIS